MKTSEEKLIALKVLLSVQNISELSLLSKKFKNKSIAVSEKYDPAFTGLILVTPYVKEVSWLLVQLQYIFQEKKDSFFFLCESLKIKLAKKPNIKEVSNFLIEESGKLLE